VDGSPGLDGVEVGVLPGVLGTPVGVLDAVSFAEGFESLPQATNTSPSAATPAAVTSRACFHPRVDMSPQSFSAALARSDGR
jgi:hypothetical protein